MLSWRVCALTILRDMNQVSPPAGMMTMLYNPLITTSWTAMVPLETRYLAVFSCLSPAGADDAIKGDVDVVECA